MSERAPIEIWDLILHECISFDSNLALEATCTPETYLAYQKTHNFENYPPSREYYIQSENTRRILRLVCRAWKAFVDDTKYQDRWVTLLPYSASDKTQHSTCDLPLRIDISCKGLLDVDGATNVVLNWFESWSYLDMRVVRLEILHLFPTTFDQLFDAFCDASDALGQLRSLAISITVKDPRVLNAISERFPCLTHLTLLTHLLGDNGLSEARAVQPYQVGTTFSFDELEVLFLRPSPDYFDLELWTVPKLHTFAMNPIPVDWDRTLYPFLQRYAKQIESLDLGNLRIFDLLCDRSPPDMILPMDFWEEFDHLKLLRTNLRYITFPQPSKRNHPLQWLVDVNPVNDTRFANNLQEMSHTYPERKQMKLFVENINKKLCVDDLGQAAGTILRQMKQHGVMVISNNTEPLI